MRTPRRSKIACRSLGRRIIMRNSATSGLITSARLKISSNVDRFPNKIKLENATW